MERDHQFKKYESLQDLSLLSLNFHPKEMSLHKSLEKETTKPSTFICQKVLPTSLDLLTNYIMQWRRLQISNTLLIKKFVQTTDDSKKLFQYWTCHPNTHTIFRCGTRHPINDNLSIICHSCYHCKSKSKYIMVDTKVNYSLLQNVHHFGARQKTLKCIYLEAHDKHIQLVVFILK